MPSKTYTVTDINGSTGITIERDATEAELAQIAIDEAAAAVAQAEAEAKATAKAALLTKLGITAEEASLLLG